MHKLALAATLAAALATALPEGAMLSPAHAQFGAPATSATMVKPNRYGLPDFGDLVEEVGPAVVNISVVQRQASSSGAAAICRRSSRDRRRWVVG